MSTKNKNNSKQLEAARRAKTEKLGGISPRRRGVEKTNAALDWIYRWGWSTPSTLEIIAGSRRSGLAVRLVKAGLLIKTRTKSGGGLKGVPGYILTLSALGLSEIERIRTSLLPYEIDPYKINQSLLRHDNLAQTATANALARDQISGYLTEKELAEKSVAGVKQPDVIWLQAEKRIALEIELSAKWDRALDIFVRGCLRSLHPSADGQPARCDYVAVVSDSPAIIKRYREAFRSGARYGIWQKDSTNYWRRVEEKTVPSWAEEKLLWQLIEFD